MIELITSGIPWNGPLVYVALGNYDCLYVGMSRNGAHRAFTNKLLYKERSKICKIRFYRCASKQEAFLLEKQLTHSLKPIFGSSLYENSKCCICKDKIIICRTYRGRKIKCIACKTLRANGASEK